MDDGVEPTWCGRLISFAFMNVPMMENCLVP